MFLPLNHAEASSDLPEDCSFRESDWHVLAGFWHPVAFVHEVEDKPLRRTLLDIDLVVFRGSDGIAVARDRCPHRGARLSAGVVEEGCLVCPMHGLAYDQTGACQRIPSVPEGKIRIPKQLCLSLYRSAERYGLIWTCLKPEPSWPLPEWPQLEEPDRKCIHVPSDEWATSAGRHVENFNDVAHFPWVHLKSFGGKKGDPIPPYKVEQTERGLAFELAYLEGGNRFPDGVEAKDRQVRYLYELTYPFSTLLHVYPEGSNYAHYFADSACPVSARRTRIFQLYTDSTGDPDADTWTAEALVINEEDKPLVEDQRPIELPLDVSEEISIPADRMSLAYRKGLVKRFGLGAEAGTKA
ncbi:MAG: aromatic ring-hydroxylating dioxygenase subunit alpha [Pseudomonadota bacterium]